MADFDAFQHICCIGAKRLGAFTMLALAHRYPTKIFTVVDEDDNLIARWNQDHPLPFSEPQLEELVAQHRNLNLFFNNNIVAAIQQATLIFVAIEMRTKEGIGEKGRIELDKWIRMVELIRDNANETKFIIDKSSIPFGMRNNILSLLQQPPGQYQHQVFANPEFFSQGSAFQTLLQPQRVVFGRRSLNADPGFMHQLYHFVPNRVEIGNVRALEFAKIFSNALLGCLGSLANIGSTFADDLMIDVNDIFQVISGDHRLGNGFLDPNVAVGGRALQRDIAYMAYMAEEYNHKEISALFKMFIGVNKKRKEQFVKRMLDTMISLEGATIVILGFAFKEGTEDVSDSPAIHICEYLLKKEKAKLRIHDPIVPDEIIKRCIKATHVSWNQNLQVLPLNDALFEGAYAICFMTRAPEFLPPNIDFLHIRPLMRNPPYVFDFTGNLGFNVDATRNAGFQVYISGRP